MRYRAAFAAVCLALAGTALAADEVVVEDWAHHRVGARSIPAEWRGHDWGSPKYDLTIVDNDGHRVLHLKSKDEGSTVTRAIKGKVDLKRTPVLAWSWKAVTLPRGGNACKAATDDQAIQLYVTWPRFPEAVRSLTLGYIWDTSAPVGTVCKSEKSRTVTYLVVQSGTANLGKWVEERRNVAEDFRKVYGEAPENPAAVSVAIDSNDTRSEAESFIGPIVFRAR